MRFRIQVFILKKVRMRMSIRIFYDRSEAKRVLYENILYGVTSEPARPGRHAF